MKIIVQRRDGRTETLDLNAKYEVLNGNVLNRLVSETGMEHFFTQEGIYDGWGQHLPEGMTLLDGCEIIEAIEANRDIKDDPLLP